MPFATDPDKRFRFTLARKLGMTVRELGTRLDVGEYRAWAAWLAVEAAFAADAAKAGGEYANWKW